MPASSQTRELLADAPFVVLLTARTISMLGMAFAPVALAFGILALPGADAGTLSIVLAAQTIPLVLFMLVGGVVADRYPRSLVLLWGQLLAAASWSGIGVMLLTGYTPLWLLCIASAVAGMSGAAVYPALSGIIPDLVPAHLLQQGNAWLSMGASAARFAGLVASGAVVMWLGGGWAMVFAGALYLVVRQACLRMLPRGGSLAQPEGNPLRQLVDGWGEFRSRQWLFVCVLQWAVLLMVLQASQGVLGPVVAKAELGGAPGWTAVLAGEALGAIVGVVDRDGLASGASDPRRHPADLRCGRAPAAARDQRAAVGGRGLGLLHGHRLRPVRRALDDHDAARGTGRVAVAGGVLRRARVADARPGRAAARRAGGHPVRGARALIGTGVISIATTVFALCFPEVRRLRSRHQAAPDVARAA